MLAEAAGNAALSVLFKLLYINWDPPQSMVNKHISSHPLGDARTNLLTPFLRFGGPCDSERHRDFCLS